MTQTALDTLDGVPYGLDVLDGELPDLYLTYVLLSSNPGQHADNLETERLFRIQVSIYSRDDFTSMPDVDGAMTAVGFSKSDWRSLPYSTESGHHGLAKDYTILLNQT